MKVEIYNALAALNSGFDVILKSLTVSQQEGVLSEEFAQDQSIRTEELRAVINYMIVQRLTSGETEDVDHFGRMRSAVEARHHFE